MSTATFLTRDPFEGVMMRAMSRNGYSYVEGNPVNFADPSGKFLPGIVAALIVLAEVAVVVTAAILALDVMERASDNLLCALYPRSRACKNQRTTLEELCRGIGEGLEDLLRPKFPSGPVSNPVETFDTPGGNLSGGYYTSSGYTDGSGYTADPETGEKSVDPRNLPENPDDLVNKHGWTEIPTPAPNRRIFHGPDGAVVEFDKGVSGAPGWGGKDHYHVQNPNGSPKDKGGKYLDLNGNPVNDGANRSHIPRLLNERFSS